MIRISLPWITISFAYYYSHTDLPIEFLTAWSELITNFMDVNIRRTPNSFTYHVDHKLVNVEVSFCTHNNSNNIV